jgi:hypothetical protein
MHIAIRDIVAFSRVLPELNHMKLTLCKDRRSKSLEEYYGSFAASGHPWLRSVGEQALRLLDHLQTLPEPELAWGLQSSYDLCLLAADDYRTPRYVRIRWGTESYWVEYLMPEAEAPWPLATVCGEARSVNVAVEMIGTAMRLSGGWQR